MEKLICALWAPQGESRADYAERLKAALPAALKEAGATAIRLNVRDATVEPAALLLQTWQQPQQDALVQFWLPTANAHSNYGWSLNRPSSPTATMCRRPDRAPGAGHRPASSPSDRT